jgi:hypothetical protein
MQAMDGLLPIGGAVCRVPLVNVLVPKERLRAELETMRRHGLTQITLEGLRKSCLVALETDDGEIGVIPSAQPAVAEVADVAAAVAAARIVYHYVKLGHMWNATTDRRDRLYYLSNVLETLDWIEGHVVLADDDGAAG